MPAKDPLTDTAKAKSAHQVLDIRINNEVEAKQVLDGLTLGLKSMAESDRISAKDFTHAQQAYGYIAGKIYQQWPDLVPKQ